MGVKLVAVLAAVLLAQSTGGVAWSQTGHTFADWLADAEQGDAWAQYYVGMRYYHGRDIVPRDITKAVTWMRKAGEQGVLEAQATLGWMFYAGRDVEVDYAEAMKWNLMAAEQGNMTAPYLIGDMYYNGQGTARDVTRAMAWYRKSAEKEYGEAQLALGRGYISGTGVSQDYVEAYKWLTRADARLADEAVTDGLLAECVDHMSPAQMDEVNAWKEEREKNRPPPQIIREAAPAKSEQRE